MTIFSLFLSVYPTHLTTHLRTDDVSSYAEPFLPPLSMRHPLRRAAVMVDKRTTVDIQPAAAAAMSVDVGRARALPCEWGRDDVQRFLTINTQWLTGGTTSLSADCTFIKSRDDAAMRYTRRALWPNTFNNIPFFPFCVPETNNNNNNNSQTRVPQNNSTENCQDTNLTDVLGILSPVCVKIR